MDLGLRTTIFFNQHNGTRQGTEQGTKQGKGAPASEQLGQTAAEQADLGTVVLMAVIAVIIWQLTPVSDKEVRRNELVVEGEVVV